MRVPFERIAHFVTVPVSAGDVETRFVLDTGIGLTLIAEALCERAGCTPTGETFSGPRMSGQEVTLPLGRLSSLAVGDLAQHDVLVGILDMSGFPAELAGIGGFLSLTFFADRPFTVDYPNGSVVLDTPATLAERRESGTAVGIDPHPHGPALDVFLPLTIPGKAEISVEVDMGSDVLILDEGFVAELGVDGPAPDLRPRGLKTARRALARRAINRTAAVFLQVGGPVGTSPGSARWSAFDLRSRSNARFLPFAADGARPPS